MEELIKTLKHLDQEIDALQLLPSIQDPKLFTPEILEELSDPLNELFKPGHAF